MTKDNPSTENSAKLLRNSVHAIVEDIVAGVPELALGGAHHAGGFFGVQGTRTDATEDR